MRAAIFAGMTNWQWAGLLLLKPMVALLGVVVVASVVHWMIERRALGPKDTR